MLLSNTSPRAEKSPEVGLDPELSLSLFSTLPAIGLFMTTASNVAELGDVGSSSSWLMLLRSEMESELREFADERRRPTASATAVSSSGSLEILLSVLELLFKIRDLLRSMSITRPRLCRLGSLIRFNFFSFRFSSGRTTTTGMGDCWRQYFDTEPGSKPCIPLRLRPRVPTIRTAGS